MTQHVQVADISAEDEYVPFSAAGEKGKGEFRCADCGYAITVHTSLPTCPMCASKSWEPGEWSPFARAPDSPLPRA